MHDLKLAFITRPTKVDNPKQSKGEKNTHTQDEITQLTIVILKLKRKILGHILELKLCICTP